MLFAGFPAVWLLFAAELRYSVGLQCFSCFRSCKQFKSCDCARGECVGPFCFARLVAYEGFYGVHKGCTSDTAGFLVAENKCLRDRSDHSADCVCNSTSFCNNKAQLKEAKKLLNSVKCCHHTVELSDTPKWQKCSKLCKGTYCYDDRISDEKGCGHSRSELLRLLRIPTFQDLGSSSLQICAKITSNGDREVLVDGCICTGKLCNRGDYQANQVDKQNSARISCNSCEVRENQTDTCGLGQKCLGDFCFVHFKSHQVAQYLDEENGGAPVQEYLRSYQYGCINTTRPELIQLGCSQEWEGESNQTESKLTSVECLCDKNFCNTEPDHLGNLWSPIVETLEQENLIEFGSGMASSFGINYSIEASNLTVDESGSGFEFD